MPMPNRNIQDTNGYRYAYQGQEKDPETGKEAFELRLWDGRIGRWLTTDPAGQYHSPYLGMGNNPISRIDPDGGSDGPGDSPVIQLPEVVITVKTGKTGNFFGWFELTKSRLMIALGTVNPRVAERKFEKLVQSWGASNISGFVVPTGAIDDMNTLPDGVSIGQTLIMPSGKFVPNTILWEAKAKSTSNLRNKKQQQRTINYLGKLGKGRTRNAYNIVTTADVTSVSNVRDYAEERGVAVHHLVAYTKRNFDGSYSFKLMERNEGTFWGYNDREPTFMSNIVGQKTIKF